MQKDDTYEAPLHPRTWPTWLGFGLWWLLVWVLPFKVQLWCGKKLGRVAGKVAKERAMIARTNLALCFPEKTPQERDAIFWESMETIGIGFFEFGMSWFGPIHRLRNRYTLVGLEHLEQAKDENKGVLIIGLHHVTLEIGAAFIGLNFPVDGFYQPHKNAVYEYIMKVGRERHNTQGKSYPKKNIRGTIKALRKGRAILYLNDQDLGPKRSEFVPFFGVPTATVVGTSQLVRAGDAKVLHYVTHRTRDGQYTVRFFPPVSEFGQGSDLDDATLINEFVEREVRAAPELYLWVHRRFKTRPAGDPPLY